MVALTASRKILFVQALPALLAADLALDCVTFRMRHRDCPIVSSSVNHQGTVMNWDLCNRRHLASV
jgi:hypothetical protein